MPFLVAVQCRVLERQKAREKMVGQSADPLGVILLHVSNLSNHGVKVLVGNEVRNSEECADFQQGANALKAMHVQSE
jgi:hypothetical protein